MRTPTDKNAFCDFPYGSLSITQSFLPVSTKVISEALRVTCEPRSVTRTTGKLYNPECPCPRVISKECSAAFEKNSSSCSALCVCRIPSLSRTIPFSISPVCQACRKWLAAASANTYPGSVGVSCLAGWPCAPAQTGIVWKTVRIKRQTANRIFTLKLFLIVASDDVTHYFTGKKTDGWVFV